MSVPWSDGVKSLSRAKIIGRRWRLSLQRYTYDLDQLDQVSQSIKKQAAAIEHKTRARAEKLNKPVNPYYIRCIRSQEKVSQRYYRKIKRQAETVLGTTRKLFGDLSADEADAKFRQIMRIPQHEFAKFNDIEPAVRESRLIALIEQYGPGTKNGGFAEAELNMQGFYHDSHTLNDNKEKDGSRRRPQFIHELISRLIYGCIYPEKCKQIFFLRTPNLVKKWGHKHRQMRSEGRFAVVRVLIVMLPYLDYKRTMRMGYKSNSRKKFGEFLGITREEIAKRAGLSLDSVKNALKSLEEQCLIHRGKQFREEYVGQDGKIHIKGLAAVRCVSANLIVRLGLGDRWMEQERKVNENNHNNLSDDQKELIDDLNYARRNPDQFSNKEIAAMEIKLALI